MQISGSLILSVFDFAVNGCVGKFFTCSVLVTLCCFLLIFCLFFTTFWKFDCSGLFAKSKLLM